MASKIHDHAAYGDAGDEQDPRSCTPYGDAGGVGISAAGKIGSTHS
jgi:hypothetical protein